MSVNILEKTLADAVKSGVYEKTDTSRLDPELRSVGEMLNTLLERLSESEEKSYLYESVLDSIPFAISVTDMDMVWKYVNPAVFKISGIKSKEEAIGKRCSDLGVSICNTENCSSRLLGEGRSENIFEHDNRVFKCRMVYVNDSKGRQIGMMETIEDVTDNRRMADYLKTGFGAISDQLEKITEGDFNSGFDIPPADEYTKDLREDILFVEENLQSVKDTLKSVVSASKKLGNSLSEGDFSVKLDDSEYKGAYGDLVRTLNKIPVSMKEPLDVTLSYIEMIANGKIPEKISSEFKGDFNALKNDLNLCVEGLSGLGECEKVLNKMAVNDYSINVKGEYRGIFGNLADEINTVQTRLFNVIAVCVKTSNGDLSKLAELSAVGRRSEKDELVPALVKMMEAVQKIIDDTSLLSEHIVNGDLKERIDVSGHAGAFADVVTGINSVLDAVITPLNEAIRISDVLAKGDFTGRFDDRIDTRGDLLRFKNAVNNIGISVSEAMESVKSVSVQVSVSSGEVTKGADEVAKAAEGVANTSQKTADLTKDLLERIEEITRQIADLSASNEEIASTSQEVFNAANHVVEIGKEAQGLGNDANNKMKNVETIAKESVIEIEELTEKIKEVSNVVKLINDITSQINLLALNAAIEAARAGEHGRGFAVVAGEVKNLAAEARAATDSIGNVVSTVQNSSEKTAKAITSSNDEIMAGVVSVTKAIESLNTIITNAGQVSHDIGEITKAIEDQADIANNVVQAAEDGNTMTKNVQKEAEELAALAEEASASVEEIGSAIHEVSSLSDELKKEMERFKT